jgi:hypothetical protein
MSVTVAAGSSSVSAISQESDGQLRQNRAALFVLKTSEIHKLPLSTMESLLPDISILVQHAIDTLQERAIAKEPITEEIVRDICQDEDIISPFSDMETSYQHTQHFKAHLHMNVRDTTVMENSLGPIPCSVEIPMLFR